MAHTTDSYVIMIDRNDGRGLSLDGCWGGENVEPMPLAEATSTAKHLHEMYPDCDWVVLDVSDCGKEQWETGIEIDRIEAEPEEDED